MNRWVRIAMSVASLALAAGLIVYLPSIIGSLTGATMSWGQIGGLFAAVSWQMAALMTAVWLASLLAYTFVLTGSLPGLGHTQALTLNAAGSAVSNLLPFGGAAGVALTMAMTKGWGFPVGAIVASTLVSGVWNMIFRFLLPAVGILALLLSGTPLSPTVTKAGWAASGSLLALVVIVGAALFWDRGARVIGHGADRLVALSPKKIRPAERWASGAIHRLRADMAGVVRSGWLKMSLGMVFFLGFQWLILALCMAGTGSWVGTAQSIAVFALSRVLTSALATPSGAGFMEAGTALALIGFGAGEAQATAAAILFGFWTYTIEIPWGGLALGGWALLRRRDGRRESEPVTREKAS
ncbi:lysylphosphatidylglycerol synthase domain-containing protein [Herbidospora cretacea]|uniref:lysylphosphatidylglycerol synthase domain-containing protein n=1 Tax=Herbidospora cretacea TaxID=28444 RepID=UPI00068C830F|nr:lysylphosphatidylglycerol synthase domain-containing protein [Herbidospora cretacea]